MLKTLFPPHSFSKTKRQLQAGLLAVTAFVTAIHATAQDKVLLEDSLVPVSRRDAFEEALKVSDFQQPISFMVSLRMRNFRELQTRVQRGETVPYEEMVRWYYPLQEDCDKVRAWLTGQGLMVDAATGPQLGLYAHGNAGQVAAALQTQFVKLSNTEDIYLTADVAPAIPAGLASAVLGIHGLQPEFRGRPALIATKLDAGKATGTGPVTNAPITYPYSVSQIFTAYNGTNLPKTGSGQKIAIVGTVYPNRDDLAQFWSANGISQQSQSNIETTQPIAGNQDTSDIGLQEANLDVQWTSGIAPNAQVRFYCSTNLQPNNVFQTYQAISNEIDAGQQPNLHQVSLSIVFPETQLGSAYKTEQQYITTLASKPQGVTIFAASGDHGSSGDPNKPGTAVVSTPASEPLVVAVGGTSLTIDTSGAVSESGWSGSGGGVSQYFNRPDYQSGIGVAGNKRVVPDVAAIADPNPGAYFVFRGNVYRGGGTSLATPIWAGICARVNNGRSDIGVSAFGTSGNKFNNIMYPLTGKAALRDITAGSNGAYSAISGYDQVTGCGVPRIASVCHNSLFPFTQNEVELTNAYYYMDLPNGNSFGYFTYADLNVLYHNDMGFLSVFNTNPDGAQGIYLYDFKSGDTFYTSYTYPFPFLYDFTLNATLYYYPDGSRPRGYYTTNPRQFYNTATGQNITR